MTSLVVVSAFQTLCLRRRREVSRSRGELDALGLEREVRRRHVMFVRKTEHVDLYDLEDYANDANINNPRLVSLQWRTPRGSCND